MERQVWLAERRAALAGAWDAEAAVYGDGPQPWDVQRTWVARVLGLIPPGGVVLDAPCGTGKYFAMLAAAGHRVAGADQSAGMLARARARGIAFSLERTSLQDLSYAGRFDAVLTIEAMQHIPPEDWPGVLANLRRAARPGGLVYLTVQDLHQHHIQRAFESLCARGPSRAAQIILDGVARNQAAIVFPASIRWARRACRLSPRLSDGYLLRQMRESRRYRTAASGGEPNVPAAAPPAPGHQGGSASRLRTRSPCPAHPHPLT